jgi:hypothetical protein
VSGRSYSHARRRAALRRAEHHQIKLMAASGYVCVGDFSQRVFFVQDRAVDRNVGLGREELRREACEILCVRRVDQRDADRAATVRLGGFMSATPQPASTAPAAATRSAIQAMHQVPCRDLNQT